jgi:hypothetical protein
MPSNVLKFQDESSVDAYSQMKPEQVTPTLYSTVGQVKVHYLYERILIDNLCNVKLFLS